MGYCNVFATIPLHAFSTLCRTRLTPRRLAPSHARGTPALRPGWVLANNWRSTIWAAYSLPLSIPRYLTHLAEQDMHCYYLYLRVYAAAAVRPGGNAPLNPACDTASGCAVQQRSVHGASRSGGGTGQRMPPLLRLSTDLGGELRRRQLRDTTQRTALRVHSARVTFLWINDFGRWRAFSSRHLSR